MTVQARAIATCTRGTVRQATICCHGSCEQGRRFPLVVPRVSPRAGRPAPIQQRPADNRGERLAVGIVLVVVAFAAACVAVHIVARTW